MLVAVNRSLDAVNCKPFDDQPAQIGYRQPGCVQMADFQGKVPRIYACVAGAVVGVPETRQGHSKIAVKR